MVGVGAAAATPAAFAARVGLDPVVAAALVGVYATAAGVLIDLDHFVVARVNTGSWRAARYCLGNPRAVFFDQGSIFREGEVGVLKRLLSHVLIAGALVGALAVVLPYLAVVTAVSLYVHLLADLLWDNHQAARVVKKSEGRGEGPDAESRG